MDKEIAINLSKHIYNALILDMKKFGFVNKNGEPNKSGFVSVVASNHNLFSRDRENTINLNLDVKYRQILSAEQLNELKEFVNGLFYFANYDDTGNYLHDKRIYLKPTKSNINVFTYIYDVVINSADASRYLRNILNAYISKPSFARQQIIFNKEFTLINQAIIDENLIAFNVDNVRITTFPYTLYYDETSDLYFLIGYDILTKKTSFYYIHKIKYLNILQETQQLTKNQIKSISAAIAKHFNI